MRGDASARARRAAWQALGGWLVAGPARGRLGSRKRPFPPPDLPAPERTRARHLAEGAVRRARSLDRVLGDLARGRRPRPEGLHAALMLGALELLFEPGTPAAAIVDGCVDLARLAAGEGGARFANALLRRLAERRTLDAWIPEPPAGPEAGDAALGERWSLPDALVARWRAAHGEAVARRLFASTHAEPALGLRVNLLQGSREECAALLAAEGVATRPGFHPTSLVVDGRPAGLFDGPAFRAGRFSVQDPTQCEVVDLVAPAAGERVLDLCAAPGTKTTGLAEAGGDRAEVWAFDRSAERLAGLPAEAARLGLSSIRICGDPGAPEALAAARPFDKVLVDAPCSNTGVLHRRAEARWRFDARALAACVATQRALLERGTALLAPGGLLVWSTCSIEPEENEDVVSSPPGATGLRLLSCERFLPEPGLRDGGGVAVLVRETP
ncbi:MAG: transcription antitermination factor NusB [Planctomycetota bacterium]